MGVGVSVSSSSTGRKPQPRKQSDWEEAKKIRKVRSSTIMESSAPMNIPVKSWIRLVRLKLVKPLEQLGGAGAEQPDLKPSPVKFQPTRLPKLRLLLLHCRLQPILQPLLQLLEDDGAVG